MIDRSMIARASDRARDPKTIERGKERRDSKQTCEDRRKSAHEKNETRREQNEGKHRRNQLLTQPQRQSEESEGGAIENTVHR